MSQTASARFLCAQQQLALCLSSELTAKQELTEALNVIVDAVGAQAGTLWFYNRFEDGLIRPRAVCGANQLNNIYILPGEGIAGQVIESGEAVMIEDCRTDARWTKKVDVETGFVTKSTLCVPLIANELVFGSIQLVNKLENDRTSTFDEDDFALLKDLTACMADLLVGKEILGEYNSSHQDQMLEKENDTQRMMVKRLSAYMDPCIIQEILRSDGKHKKSLRAEQIVVLFADIRGFTGLAEKLSSAQLISALSDFLAITSGCIHRYQGIIDKFMGDCTMAYWRCDTNPHAAIAASRCALDIQREAEAFSAQIFRQTGIEIGIGIGIHVGPVLLCHVGDEQYMAYTVIGSTVNTACRIEEHAPAGCVYISEDLRGALLDKDVVEYVQEQPVWRDKDDHLIVLNLKDLKQ